jgi:hypothetical protein
MELNTTTATSASTANYTGTSTTYGSGSCWTCTNGKSPVHKISIDLELPFEVNSEDAVFSLLKHITDNTKFSLKEYLIEKI